MKQKVCVLLLSTMLFSSQVYALCEGDEFHRPRGTSEDISAPNGDCPPGSTVTVDQRGCEEDPDELGCILTIGLVVLIWYPIIVRIKEGRYFAPNETNDWKFDFSHSNGRSVLKWEYDF